MFTNACYLKQTNDLTTPAAPLVRHIVQSFHTALLALAFLACGRAEPVAETRFRVALLTPGPISDQAWNASAFAGLERIRDSLGATVSHVQTRTPADFEENFRQYGQDGFDLVIGHGFEFQDAAMRVGREFPATTFITTGGASTAANVAPLSFAFEEPSYLAGMAAAAVSRSGVIGAIGGTELPPVRTSFAAYEAGARAVNPAIRVLVSYVGNWEDAAAGKEQALAQVARGADVIFQNADAAGLGIFQAMREAPGRWIIGANADQNAIAPAITLGSVVIDIPHAFLLVAREVQERRFASRIVRLDAKTDVVRWVPNPALEAIPEGVRVRMDSVNRELRAGRFRLPAASVP